MGCRLKKGSGLVLMVDNTVSVLARLLSRSMLLARSKCTYLASAMSLTDERPSVDRRSSRKTSNESSNRILRANLLCLLKSNHKAGNRGSGKHQVSSNLVVPRCLQKGSHGRPPG